MHVDCEVELNALFLDRDRCISCEGEDLVELSSGTLDRGAVASFINADPWGENPMPFLGGKPWSYVRCGDCEQAFHRYILAPEWNERRFTKWMSQAAIEDFERQYKTPIRLFEKARRHANHVLQLEKSTRQLRRNETLRILDFGCGYGDFLSICDAFGFEAYGIDRSMAKRSHSRFGRVFAEFEDLDENLEKDFHVITLFEVLEHLDDPRGVLESLARRLLPGGVLVLESPDCTGVEDIVTRQDYVKIHPLDHINGFTPATLRSFAESLGFEAMAKPLSQVGADLKSILKIEAKRALGRLIAPNTQQYFRKK